MPYEVSNTSSGVVEVNGRKLDQGGSVVVDFLSSKLKRLVAEGKVRAAPFSEDNTIEMARLPANASSTAPITSSDPVVIDMENVEVPKLFWVVPVSATVRVEYSRTGGASYVKWEKGDVSVPTDDDLRKTITHLLPNQLKVRRRERQHAVGGVRHRVLACSASLSSDRCPDHRVLHCSAVAGQ